MASKARHAKRTPEFFKTRRKERKAAIVAINATRKDFTGQEYFQAKFELLNDYINGVKEEFEKMDWDKKPPMLKAFAARSRDELIKRATKAYKKKYGNNKYSVPKNEANPAQ